MNENEYLLYADVMGRMQDARDAAATRAAARAQGARRGMRWSRAPMGDMLAGVYLDRRLLAFTRGVRLRIAAAVALGLLQVVMGITRLALLGWLLARVFAGASLAELSLPLALTAAAIVLRGVFEYARTVVAHRTAAIVQ